MFKLDVSKQALGVGVAIVTVSALKSLSIYKGKGKKNNVFLVMIVTLGIE